ncbi:MAG: hypothetical protein KGI25_02875 [Thaumarchaeota archaeon]|nr:hypothetical protein [Nitrososphaerota archaeon]
MASLEALTKSYRAKKAEVAKLRRKSENNLKKTLSLKRRSSSGLISLERKKETLERQLTHIVQLLNQYNAQKESIARLKIAAEERLKHEMDAQDSLKQQIDYGAPEEKTSLQERLRFIDEKISELRVGMKEREAAEARLEKQIADLEKERAKLGAQIKSQVHVKPVLVQQLRSSEKEESVLRPKVQSLIKRESQTSEALKSIEKKLADALAQRRKAKRKLQRAKRKVAKRKAGKRKPARKAKTKARVSRKKAARKTKTRSKTRTARRAKKRVAKRRVAKRTSSKRKTRSKARRR